jgi:CRISPR-associated protein Cmr1
MSAMSDRVKRGPTSTVGRGSPDGVIAKTFHVVTLLHGGGTRAGEDDHPQTPERRPDAITPVRGTAVRGQLRFWWRAIHGCLLPSLKEMRTREDVLWGRSAQTIDDVASGPGRVSIAIRQSKKMSNVLVADLRNPQDRPEGIGQGLRYGAFASKNLTRLSDAITITVTVKGDDATDREQVEDALQAWLFFGGVGGRTRRGFGALAEVDGKVDVRTFLAGFNKPTTLRDVPTLHGATVAFGPHLRDKAEAAHRDAVDALRRFRQKPGFARSEGNGPRPGRSYWPEPDALRRHFKRHTPGHEPQPQWAVDAFPRAAFGLPIVFHFQDREDPSATLTTARGRLASPLILRPLRIANNRWQAMALRLHVPGLDDLLEHDLKFDKDARNTPLRGRLREAELQRVRPLSGLAGGTDILAAFLDFFQRA